MILVIGGAYQGKLDYAKETFGVSQVYDCSEGAEPVFDAEVIYGLEGFSLACAEHGGDSWEAVDFFKANREKWENRILIITDISQGIVPVEKTLRAHREINGRLMIYLAGEAAEVHRVFCGLGKRVK